VLLLVILWSDGGGQSLISEMKAKYIIAFPDGYAGYACLGWQTPTGADVPLLSVIWPRPLHFGEDLVHLGGETKHLVGRRVDEGRGDVARRVHVDDTQHFGLVVAWRKMWVSIYFIISII
jgi:hypothetical protein